MLPISSQCTNLELSKELRDLGYPQEGLFWWVKFKNYWPKLVSFNEEVGTWVDGDWHSEESEAIEWKVVSPSSAELGEVLKNFGRNSEPITIYVKDEKMWFGSGLRGLTNSDTEVDARAKMVIELFKQGLLKF